MIERTVKPINDAKLVPPAIIDTHYNSVAAFVDDIYRPLKSSVRNLDYWRRSTTFGWMGISAERRAGETTFDTTVRLVADGWQNGIDRIGNTLTAFPEVRETTCIKRRMVRGDQGDEFDIHRAYAGGLDTAWTRRARVTRRAPKLVTIYMPLCVGGGHDPDELFWRGAVAVRLTEVLTTAGYDVEVIGCLFGETSDYGGSPVSRVTIELKSAHMPVDLNNLVATTACPAFFRSLGHAYQSHIAKKVSPGRGYYPSFAVEAHIKPGPNEIVLPTGVRESQVSEVFQAAIDKATGYMPLAA